MSARFCLIAGLCLTAAPALAGCKSEPLPLTPAAIIDRLAGWGSTVGIGIAEYKALPGLGAHVYVARGTSILMAIESTGPLVQEIRFYSTVGTKAYGWRQLVSLTAFVRSQFSHEDVDAITPGLTSTIEDVRDRRKMYASIVNHTSTILTSPAVGYVVVTIESGACVRPPV
jgi:hypothetical protein